MFDWASPVDGALKSLLRAEDFEQSDADRAYHALATLLTPTLIVKYIGRDEADRFYPTNRMGGPWASGRPTGWVDHYTAAASTASTLRWFSAKPRPAGYLNSSAHVVISPLGEIMIVVPPNTHVAYHATKANASCIGVEHVNCGRLDTQDGKTFKYMDNKIAYAIDAARPPVFAEGSWWEPFATAQVVANIVFKRLMRTLLPTLKQKEFTEHRVVSPGVKFDCGPMWPLETINNLVFSKVDVSKLAWTKTDYLTPPNLRAMVEESDAALLALAPKTEPTNG